MNREDFKKLVAEAYDAIPKKFRKKIENVALTVEDEPTPEERARRNLQPGVLLLGLYVGIPATQRGANYGVSGVLPDVIKIYQNPIEQIAEGDPERIKEIVHETVLHEYAHHFGMSEAQVRAWEKEGERGGE